MSAGVANDRGVHVPGRWLRSLSDTWPRSVCRLLDAGESAVVRVLVAEVRGSAPREPGTCMLVCRSETYGTIGGGNLEWQALGAAQSLLSTGSHSVQLRRLVLGRELGQCCGGVVQLWLERYTASDLPLLRRAAQGAVLTHLSREGVLRKLVQSDAAQPQLRFSCSNDGEAVLLERIERKRAALWLYGAGHVGQMLIRILAELPFEVTWVDSRAELLPESLPDNVHPLCSLTPTNTVDSAPPAAHFLVMTHNHALDYSLCSRVLGREDFAWLGLIGSKSKAARFRSRLARDGVTPEAIGRLVCPIGVDGVTSKLPAAIAVAVAAQLLRGLEPAAELAPCAKPGAERPPGVQPAALAEVCTSPDCAACSSVAHPVGSSTGKSPGP